MSVHELLNAGLSELARGLGADAVIAWLARTRSTSRVVASWPVEILADDSLWPIIPAAPLEEAIASAPATDPATLSRLLPITFRLTLPAPALAVWAAALHEDGSGVMAVWWTEAPPALPVAQVQRDRLNSVSDELQIVGLRLRVGYESARLSAVTSTLHQALVFVDDSGEDGIVNEAAGRLLGLATGELPSADISQALTRLRTQSRDARRLNAEALRLLADPDARITDWLWRFDDQPTDLKVSSTPIHVDSIVGRLWVFDDVSAQMLLLREAVAARATAEAARAELARSEERFRMVLLASAAGVLLAAEDGTIITANSAMTRLLGLADHALEGRNWFDLVVSHTPQEKAHREALLTGLINDYRSDIEVQDAHGGTVVLDAAVAVSRRADGAIAYLVVQVSDVTAQRRAFREATRRAGHDSLTGLPNRTHFNAGLAAALEALPESAGDVRVGVLFCDLDGFKAVNDTHGHAAGDVVLVEVADRLRQGAPDGDLVARLGGDEFVLLLPHVSSKTQMRRVGEHINALIVEPISLHSGATVSVGASIGGAVSRPGETATSLLSRADAAMYQAKRRGRHPVVCAD